MSIRLRSFWHDRKLGFRVLQTILGRDGFVAVSFYPKGLAIITLELSVGITRKVRTLGDSSLCHHQFVVKEPSLSHTELARAPLPRTPEGQSLQIEKGHGLLRFGLKDCGCRRKSQAFDFDSASA
jgi:hypothetical protein